MVRGVTEAPFVLMKIASSGSGFARVFRWAVVTTLGIFGACSTPPEPIKRFEYDVRLAHEVDSCETEACRRLQRHTPLHIPAYFEIGEVQTADILFDTWDTHVRIKCTPRSRQQWWSWRGIVMRCTDEGATEFRFESLDALLALEPYHHEREFVDECVEVGKPRRFYDFVLLEVDDPYKRQEPGLNLENARFEIVYTNAGGRQTRREYVLMAYEGYRSIAIMHHGARLTAPRRVCKKTRYISPDEAEDDAVRPESQSPARSE